MDFDPTKITRTKAGSIVIPMTKCPACGKPMDAVGDLTPETRRLPVTGDAVVCILCAAVNTFEDGKLRLMTVKEMKAFLRHPDNRQQLERVKAGIAHLKAMKN